MKSVDLGNGRALPLGERTLVMGILNVTPDSFYPHSRVAIGEDLLPTGERMVEQGADILDIGGESTRPGSDYVSEQEELDRVLPAVETLSRLGVPLSVDTRRASVARGAMERGAAIINDVSALKSESELAEVAAEFGCPIVLMHMRGTPDTMQKSISYADTVGEIADELKERAEFAQARGIDRAKIILDPGIGFGKRLQDNLLILRELDRILSLGFPVLIGASRKSFIGTILGGKGEPTPVDARLSGSLAVAAYAAAKGAHILRVHDVKETAEVVRMVDAIDKVRQES